MPTVYKVKEVKGKQFTIKYDRPAFVYEGNQVSATPLTLIGNIDELLANREAELQISLGTHDLTLTDSSGKEQKISVSLSKDFRELEAVPASDKK